MPEPRSPCPDFSIVLALAGDSTITVIAHAILNTSLTLPCPAVGLRNALLIHFLHRFGEPCSRCGKKAPQRLEATRNTACRTPGRLFLSKTRISRAGGVPRQEKTPTQRLVLTVCSQPTFGDAIWPGSCIADRFRGVRRLQPVGRRKRPDLGLRFRILGVWRARRPQQRSTG